MDTITLKYQDNISGILYTETFSPLRVKGFDPVDDLEDFPDFLSKSVDGNIIHQTIGIKRKFTIEIGVVAKEKRIFCGSFWKAINKWIIYTHDDITETVQVIRNENILQTEWKDDTVIARYIVFYLTAKNIIQEFPNSAIVYADEDTDMYIKKKVLIIGTQASPESFTTNAGKLSTCDAPAGIFPTFDTTIQKYHIDTSRVYQDCHFTVASIETTSGGDLTFTIARSDAGNPEIGTDSYYCDIAIFVRNIV